MNAPPDQPPATPPPMPPSTGKTMIAAYRAARLSQRSVLRSSLHQTHVARKAARCQGLGVAMPDPDAAQAEIPAATPEIPPHDAPPPASVFASLVNFAVTERPAEAEPAVAEPAAEAPPLPEPAPVAEAPPHDPPYDPPLAEIGFGPGMLIRLSQLGLRTTGDLAHADAMELRAALGDISRLVDVEAWISSARRSVPVDASASAQNNSANAA